MEEMTPKMKRIHSHLTDTPTLAYDIAQAAEVDNQSAGSVLVALEQRGMAGRQKDEESGVWLWYRAELPQ